jgi:hypothetical protein
MSRVLGWQANVVAVGPRHHNSGALRRRSFRGCTWGVFRRPAGSGRRWWPPSCATSGCPSFVSSSSTRRMLVEANRDGSEKTAVRVHGCRPVLKTVSDLVHAAVMFRRIREGGDEGLIRPSCIGAEGGTRCCADYPRNTIRSTITIMRPSPPLG